MLSSQMLCPKLCSNCVAFIFYLLRQSRGDQVHEYFLRCCSHTCLSHWLWRWPLKYWTWFHLPDGIRVFDDRTVRRELTRTRDIQNSLACPRVRVAIQLHNPVVCLEIRRQVSQVHVVVAMRQQKVTKGGEN